jgi:ABC-type branched-subunit amino acid transport system substrate-binding protein
MSQRFRVVTALFVVVLVAAACGQKSGVAGSEVQAGSGDTTATTAASGGGSGGGATATHEKGSDDTAGITDKEIVIGIHAPVTGASPIPQTSFDTGKDIYWQFLSASQPKALGGRKVRVVFRDDEFNPSTAVQVCREMVEKEHAFILVGGGGADQITACAKYANQNGIPYFSAGVNETGLTDLSTYYAVSLTYSAQVPLIIDQLEKEGVKKVASVVTDTPDFKDAHDTFVAAVKKSNLELVADDSINKTAGEAETLAEIGKLKKAGAEAVYLLSAPLVYLGVASSARNQNFSPIFIGPGITSGLNAVTTFGCPAVGNGQFFSPFPEMNVIEQLDPDYLPSYAKYGGGEKADDIGIALWGLDKTIALMFEAAGKNLGRAALMNAIEQGKEFSSGVYPPVQYTPEQHFGGTGAYLLKADCSAKQYTSAAKFVPAASGK